MMVADFVTRQQNGSPLNGEIPGQNHNSNSNMPAHSALLMSNNSSNSNSSGRASPHTSSESEFPQNGYELAAHLKRKELFSQRKQREFIPDNKKDDSYWDRRRRNNEAAKRSREKRRFNDMVLEQRVVELTKENHVLKAQLDAIKSKYNICGENLVSVDQIMATLPTNEQVLSSTKRVKLANGSAAAGSGGRTTSPSGSTIGYPHSRSPSRQSPSRSNGRASSPHSPPQVATSSTPAGSLGSHLQQSLLAVVQANGAGSGAGSAPSSQQAPVIHANPNVESPPPAATASALIQHGAIQHTNGTAGSGANAPGTTTYLSPMHIYRNGTIIEYERVLGEKGSLHAEQGSGRSPIRHELNERNGDDNHHLQQLQQHQQQQQHHHQHQQQQQQHHHYSHHPREVIRESVIDHHAHHPQHHQHLQQQQQQQQQQHHPYHHHRVLVSANGDELDRDERSPSPGPQHAMVASSAAPRFGSPTTTTSPSTVSAVSSPGTPPSSGLGTSISSTSPSRSPPAHPLAAHSHPHHYSPHHHPHHHHPHAHPLHHLAPHPHFVVGASSPYAPSSSTALPAAAGAQLPYPLTTAAAAVAAYASSTAGGAAGLYSVSPPRSTTELASALLTANVLNLSRRAPSPIAASPPQAPSVASTGSTSGGEDEPDVRDHRDLHEHVNGNSSLLPVKLRHKTHLGDKDAATALLALQNIKQEPVALRSSSPAWDDGDGGSSDERDSGISTNEWPTKAEQKMMVPLPTSPPAAGNGPPGKITSIPASVVISKKAEENIHLQSKLARLESEVATIKNMISNTAGSGFGVTAAAQ
ncbi:LIM domain-containing protein A-like [Anopheles ziemanni]|uniref:LIM domain-containing protein A-like n=1 Tax=Anopheles ziemanni TaxID=345580 RepID=UPI00265FB9B2|nr:LIM domain-containing protein A-like [Anopheles ziemanni]